MRMSAQALRSKHANVKKNRVEPRTAPLDKETWEAIFDLVVDRIFDELYEQAYDCDVEDLDALHVKMENIAGRLTKRFVKEAQALYKKVHLEAAALAQSKETIKKAGAKPFYVDDE